LGLGLGLDFGLSLDLGIDDAAPSLERSVIIDITDYFKNERRLRDRTSEDNSFTKSVNNVGLNATLLHSFGLISFM